MEDDNKFGFTPEAELLNLRVATVGLVIGVLTELITGVGIVHQVMSLFGM